MKHEQHDPEHGHEPTPLPEGVAVAFDDGAGEYLYRPGQIVVAAEDVGEAQKLLRREKAERLDGGGGGLGVVTFRLADDTDVPTLVSRLRQEGRGRQLRVGPNHVLSFSSHIQWAPGAEPPSPAEPRPDIPSKGALPGEGVRVGVVDTGATEHSWFAGRVNGGPGDDDPADDDGDGALDIGAGHGTFVAGVVLQHAPGASVVMRRATTTGGLTDELAVARAMLDLAEVDVLNLSLGTYGHDDQPPIALLAALQRLWDANPDVVVVAGAGNDGWDRPFWPAASKRVIGVGALDDRGDKAPFSNHGWWVDACAPGVKAHSTFLKWDGPVAHGGADASFPQWARWSGTSFAAPRVTGVIAAAVARFGDAVEAAFRVVGARGLPRRPGLGTVVAGPPVA